jgi:hypothetical protein
MQGTILMGYSETAKKFFTEQLVANGSAVYPAGGEIYSAHWNGEYKQLVLLQFEHSNFILAQSRKHRVWIQKINNDGTLALSESDSVTWKTYYPNLFSYKAGGNVYLVGQNSDRYFFIQKITSDGKFGNTTFSDTWPNFYETMGSLEIGGRVFMYYHRSDGSFKMIELKNGTLSSYDTYSAKWSKHFSTMGSIKVAGKTYLYGHTKHNGKIGKGDYKFFLNEVSSDGKLIGGETYKKYFHNFYNSMGSVYFNNRSYIYGVSEKRFFIQEVLAGGVLAPTETYSTHWGNDYVSLLTLTSDHFAFNNSWMDRVYQQLPVAKQQAMTLKDYCMPASHDSGMFKGGVTSNGLTETQELNISEQLSRGVRYFDFRVGIPTLRSEMYFMHGLPGEKLSIALDDIRNFMVNRNETVILYFSHFEIGKEKSNDFVSIVEQKLGHYLLKRTTIDHFFKKNPSLKQSINNMPMSELRGTVIALVEQKKRASGQESEVFDYNTLNGKSIYTAISYGEDDKNRAIFDTQLLACFDEYADKRTFEEMRTDQCGKFSRFGNSTIDKDALCVVDWTLTAKGASDFGWGNRDKAHEVNPKLLNPKPDDKETKSLTFPNSYGRMVNFFSVDYIPAGIVDICIQTMKNNGKL